jgi:hypothetical protein
MKTIFTFAFLILVHASFAQTNTTQDLDKKYEGLSLYFYKNTLRMLNQKDNPEFDELIKDVEKMKFLIIDRTKSALNAVEYKKLLKGYQSESYEEMMTSRFKGRNFDVYIKQTSGKVKGTVILASDSTNLYVLDIVGKVALDKATALFQAIDGNADIGKKITDFMSDDDKPKKKKEKGVKID